MEMVRPVEFKDLIRSHILFVVRKVVNGMLTAAVHSGYLIIYIRLEDIVLVAVRREKGDLEVA
jgi:hypothetical protein